METNITMVNQSDMLMAINKSEIDTQISTAKQFPRNLHDSLNKIMQYATLDPETADECFYALKRGNGDDAKVIEGLSVRMAEIIASAWGNLRVQTRIIGNDGKTITAQGICHDLETNYATSVEVKRRITDKNGRTFSEDMQVVTGNAASAIAFRNAVLKVVPKAVTKRVIAEVKEVSLGKALDLTTSRQKVVEWYSKVGVSKELLLEYLERGSMEEVNAEDIAVLRGTATAIKEGTTTAEETFIKPHRDRVAAAAAKAEAQAAKDVVAQAKSRSVNKK